MQSEKFKTSFDTYPDSNSTDVVFIPHALERLAKAYETPGGPPILPDKRVSSTQILVWLAGEGREDLRGQIVDRLKEGSFDSALCLFHNSYHPSKPPPKSSHEVSDYSDLSQTLYRHWQRQYHGDALNAIKERLNRYEIAQQERSLAYYAKYITIIQSSGTGKSRLVDQLSKEFFTIGLTLRNANERGYPPGDVEILKFLKKDSASVKMHSRMIALLCASLEYGKFMPFPDESMTVKLTNSFL